MAYAAFCMVGRPTTFTNVFTAIGTIKFVVINSIATG
jgi:hypothetical protein